MNLWRILVLCGVVAIASPRGSFCQEAPAAPAATPDPTTWVPEVARVAAKEGNDAFERGDFPGAREAYLRVLELAPDNLVGLVNLGVVEMRAGNPDEAERFLQRALSVKIDNAAAWLTLGIVYFDQNKLEHAMAAFAQATVHDPANSQAHNYLGAVLSEKGWLYGAEAALRRAVQIDPEAKDAHYNLALLYMDQRPPAVELAKRHYTRATDLGADRDTDLEKQIAAHSPRP